MSNFCTVGDANAQTLQGQMLVMNDETLLQQVTAGDADALAVLYDRYKRLVFSVALRISGDHGSAEEITQDAFVRLWQSAKHYRSERGTLLSWLLTIAQRRAIDELRSRRRAHQRQEWPLDTALARAHEGDFAAQVDLRLDLYWLIALLPAVQRTVITSIFFGGLQRHEVARRTTCPLATVHTRLRIGIAKLRALFQSEEQART